MHIMKVQTKYYQLLKNGLKRIELRLYDDKRRFIQVGDEIQFCDLENHNDCFMAKVTHLHHAPNFEALCDIIHPQQAGFSDAIELINVMQQFYPIAKQNEFGVVGIEIELI